ncbi:MAG TPA: DUF885 domain-containing protein [Candidatus Limnocylindrales bacterium]|nr:DUF885 domain-containing protein [Candidatus Limnocylindrales bacterium]
MAAGLPAGVPTADGSVTAEADAQLEALIRSRFDALMETWPSHATALGIHRHDGRLADLSRAAREADMAAEAAFISRLEATSVEDLSEPQGFERDVALHGARLRLFEAEMVAGWRRGASASRDVGDALFLLMARDFAPLEDRLESITQRLEGVPTALAQARDRLVSRPVRLWNELELGAAGDLPRLVHEIVLAARQRWPAGDARLARLERAARATREALLDYGAWIGTTLDDASADFALGREAFDALIALRDFDGLTSDDILAIGHEQLEAMHEARREAGRAIDPSLSESEVVERVKTDGPPDFETALSGYRQSIVRARLFVEAHDLATLPVDDAIEVMPTPLFMRSLIPLAAYFEPAAFDRPIRGVYIVTPSVDGDPRAMREHNWASIVNTSVHEAYPGHHHQFSAALSSPTPARLLTNAPEFHEGWAMYCEEMMLEEGFEDGPARRVIVATDAIWRACRIILDIGLHRGQIGIDDAIDFLVEHTRFERPVARAEVYRYTQTPGYNLSYLLGKVQLLRLRADERARLGGGFSLKGFHDALLYSGNLLVSFQRRLLAGGGGGPTLPEAGIQR